MNRAVASSDALKVISFDLDDTFWDCAPAINNAEQALLEWHRVHTPRITAAHDADSLLAFRSKLRERYPELAGCVTAVRLQGLRDLLSDFDYSQSLAEEAFDIFYQVRSEVVLYPQVLELLEFLAQRFKLAAITNGNADLKQIGIESYFDGIFAANLELKAKPHADMFDRCRDHFDVQSHQILHIGDNPVTDVVGGLNAGVQTLWFNQHALDWPGEQPGPHFEARSISQVLAFFC